MPDAGDGFQLPTPITEISPFTWVNNETTIRSDFYLSPLNIKGIFELYDWIESLYNPVYDGDRDTLIAITGSYVEHYINDSQGIPRGEGDIINFIDGFTAPVTLDNTPGVVDRSGGYINSFGKLTAVETNDFHHAIVAFLHEGGHLVFMVDAMYEIFDGKNTKGTYYSSYTAYQLENEAQQLLAGIPADERARATITVDSHYDDDTEAEHGIPNDTTIDLLTADQYEELSEIIETHGLIEALAPRSQ